MNPYRDLEENSFTAAPHLNYEDIATKLLKDHYFLTALELHTELVESGKELPQLREFFSNPGNFEQHVSRASDFTSMHRTPSIATLDSLDTTRYSEDGGGDRGGSGGDVAVLEFELRKAKETINSLRANLTQFADNDSPLDKSSKDSSGVHTLKPHEKRALNFLINEYLLLQDYKLTSITFSDENPDQDFEDWDDVGLNIPRPSGLAALLYGSDASLKVVTCDASTEVTLSNMNVECQTDIEDNICNNCQHALDIDGDWNHEILIQAEEIRLLKQKVTALETEKHNFQRLYDAAIVSLNSLTSPATEKGLEFKIPDERLQVVRSHLSDAPLTLTAADNHYGSNPHSMHSTTPDPFELVDNEKFGLIRKDGSNTSSFDPAIVGGSSAHDSPLHRGSVTTLDETLSINDGGEWTRIQYDYPVENTSKDMWINSGLPNNLKANLLNWCHDSLNTNEAMSNELLLELINCDKPVSLQGLLNIVADTIPKVLPHTLVGRRCEMTALLVATIHLLSVNECSDTSKRARLLHLLLTLKKAPDANETKVICEAACLIVKWGNSGEVLSCIAELLSSRTTERRVVASQICLAVAPFVSIELSTSLLLSLVIMMCESNEFEIRSLGLKAACLISAVADHKYSQLESLLFGFLKDPSEGIVNDTVNMFVPVLARTALVAGKFSTELMNKIMTNLIKVSNNKEWKIFILYMNVMRALVLAKLSYVINVQMIKDVTSKGCDKVSMNYQDISLENVQETVLDLQCFIVDNCDCKLLLVAMNNLLNESPDVRWDELHWFVHIIKQLLEIAANSKCLNQAVVYEQFIILINNYVESFGANFTTVVLKPIFLEIINNLEYKMEKLHSVVCEDAVVVGIYLVAVLPVVENKEEMLLFLHKWIVFCSIRNFPVKVFSIPLKWMNNYKSDTLDIYLQLFKDFAINTNENASGASIRAWICGAIAELIDASVVNEKSLESFILPAVMTMLRDSDVSVREPAILAWGAVARSCDCRNLECSSQCWSSMESFITNDGPGMSSREAARAAEALALLVLPTMDNMGNNICHQAVSLICELCMRATLSGDSLSAIAPAMQLAALHARTHPKLRPALKKLEEAAQNPALAQYKPAIEAMMYNVAGVPSMSSNNVDSSRDTQQKAGSSNLQAAQEVGRRVTQMFQQSKNNMNLQNIFKKKT